MLDQRPLQESAAASAMLAREATHAAREWNIARAGFLKLATFDRTIILPEDEDAEAILWFGRIALGLEALPNLFPCPQADRIRKHVLAAMIREESHERARMILRKIESYHADFQRALELNPLASVAMALRLLSDWFPSYTDAATARGVISPLAVDLAHQAIGRECGYWSHVKANFSLREQHGLVECMPLTFVWWVERSETYLR